MRTEPGNTSFIKALAAHGRAVGLAMVPSGPANSDPTIRVLSHRADEVVVHVGDIVVKAHAHRVDAGELGSRLDTAADPRLGRFLVAPIPVRAVQHGADRASAAISRYTTLVHDQLVTLWPAGTPLSRADPNRAPWRTAAGLLAGLHQIPPTPGLPAAAGPQRVTDSLNRLATASLGHGALTGAAATVRAAATTLPGWALGAETAQRPPQSQRPSQSQRPPQGQRPVQGRRPIPSQRTAPYRTALCHGDWHLGQLVEFAPLGWRMIDIDDLGVGDPAWDLGRPAAWYAAGLLSEEVWGQFLCAYLAAGGTAIAPDVDPWPRLEVPSRAITVQSAASAIVKAAGRGGRLDEIGETLVACCRRISRAG